MLLKLEEAVITDDKTLPACPAETTLALISGKWKVLFLRDLLPGTKRFGELKKWIGSVSQKVLAARLRQMEDSALLTGTDCLPSGRQKNKTKDCKKSLEVQSRYSRCETV